MRSTTLRSYGEVLIMKRGDVIRAMEAVLFEVVAEQPLLEGERYATVERLAQANGLFNYRVMGSLGSDVLLASRQELPAEPFVVMRASPSPSSAFQAITLCELDRLTEDLYSHMRLT